MKEFPFKKIDAFARGNSLGNPAGYVSLQSFSEISGKEMLQIAKELKGFVSEVGYSVKTSENSFDLKYYSSEREVDFCGHASIAIMYDLINNSPDLLAYNTLSIKTNRGVLTIENRIREEDAVFIEAPLPFEKKELPTREDIVRYLQISNDEIDDNLPVSIINAGLTTLLIPINTLDSILSISPDLNDLNKFCLQSGVDIIEVFSQDVFDASNNFRARVFAPTFGYLEDPATGSGNSAFGYYLLKNNLWNGDIITIEQNGLRDSFNVVKLHKKTDKDGSQKVLFGGGAITRIEGTYFLNE